MAVLKPDYGIVVPVRNEATVLPVTVPKLLAATKNDSVKIIWVCNGCTDGSAELIRQLAGTSEQIIEITRPSKTAALQTGDDIMGNLFPRIYLDADAWIRPGDALHLIKPLSSGAADLVAPKLCFDNDGASFVSVQIGACWLSLPHAISNAYSNAIGVSAAGRRLWGEWPDILGDDIFVSSKVPVHRRMIVPEALATIRLPRRFSGWVKMRSRWLQGENELEKLGYLVPRCNGQRYSLAKQMVSKEKAIGAWAFVAARVLAGLITMNQSSSSWLPDR